MSQKKTLFETCHNISILWKSSFWYKMVICWCEYWVCILTYIIHIHYTYIFSFLQRICVEVSGSPISLSSDAPMNGWISWWKMVRYRNKCSLTEDRWVGQNWNTYCGFHLQFLIDLCQQSCRQNFSFIVKITTPTYIPIYKLFYTVKARVSSCTYLSIAILTLRQHLL